MKEGEAVTEPVPVGVMVVVVVPVDEKVEDTVGVSGTACESHVRKTVVTAPHCNSTTEKTFLMCKTKQGAAPRSRT